MRTVDIETTAYPKLKANITDKEFIARYTLWPEEIAWVNNYRGDKLALAVRMKVFEHLLSQDLPLSKVPQPVQLSEKFGYCRGLGSLGSPLRRFTLSTRKRLNTFSKLPRAIRAMNCLI